MATLKKPSGLSISRSGFKMTYSWTVDKNYTKQEAYSIVKDRPGKNTKKLTNIKKGTKSKSEQLSSSDYYPNQKTVKGKKVNKPHLTSIKFKVRGGNGSKWTDWVTKEYKVNRPGKPRHIEPQQYNSQNYSYTFAWGRNVKDNEHNWFTDYKWQTILIKDSSVRTGADLKASDWNKCSTQKIAYVSPTTGQILRNQNSYGTGTYTSLSIIDDPSVIDGGMRRFFRVIARGPAGASYDTKKKANTWQYSDHSYAAPLSPVISSGTRIISADESGTTISIDLKTPTNYLHETNNNIFYYAIVNPRTTVTTVNDKRIPSLSLPLNFDSWTQDKQFGSTGRKSTFTFRTTDVVGEDTCMYIKIDAINDGATTSSNIMRLNMPNNALYSLSNPILTSCVFNSARSVTVNIANETSLENNKSITVIYFRSDESPDIDEAHPIGILPYGVNTGTFILPEYTGTPSIGIKTVVASYEPASKVDSYPGEYTEYSISDILMASNTVWDSSAVPKPPEFSLDGLHNGSALKVTWDWPWTTANLAELSWAETADAWTSTSEPSTYLIDRAKYTGSGDVEWVISGLSVGNWFVRLRLAKATEESVVYGPYSDAQSYDLSEAPDIPTLEVEPNVAAPDGSMVATWAYTSNDGTGQSGAQLYEVTREDETTPWDEADYTAIPDARTETATSYEFTPNRFGWEEGSEHYLSLKVISKSGKECVNYSNPIKVSVASPPVPVVTGIDETNEDAMRTITFPVGEVEDNETKTILSLVELPFSFYVGGAGEGGSASAVITRRAGFELERPDDSTVDGLDGETIYTRTIESSEDSDTINFEITLEDMQKKTNLVGHLDDEAPYRLDISVTDTFGQTVHYDPIDFEVHWTHQAQEPPIASISINQNEDISTIYVPQPSSGYEEGDYFEIYRLSADRPQKIVSDGIFGESYIDPYPTYGMFGGYRIVYVTKFGDYRVNETGSGAWTDYSPIEDEGPTRISSLDRFGIVIDFDGNHMVLPGNVSVSSTWKKDFKTTRYLGGSIEGDWNPGVERTGSFKTTIPIENDPNLMYMVRLLADYAGVCHVRTPDGSNFYANVDVQDDREEKWVRRLSQVTLSITKVDSPEEDDGVLASDWNAPDE